MIRSRLIGLILGMVICGMGEVTLDWASPIDGRLRPDGRTVATRQSPSQLRSLGSYERVSTIAGER